MAEEANSENGSVPEDDLDLTLDLEKNRFAQFTPQCMYCHSICNEGGEWVTLEEMPDAAGPFSHSTCPACEHKLFAQLGVDGSE